MELSEAQRASLDALTRQDGYDGSVSARAQIVLWRADGFSVADIVRMSGASKPTVYKWVDRYERFGVDGLTDLARSGRPPEVPDSLRSRIVALTRCTPPAETGLSHWSSRAMATYLKRTDGIAVSHNFIAQVWRDHDLQPHRQQFLVEPGRNLVQHHHQASDQARHIHLPPRPHQDNQAIHRELEPRRETLRVDSDSRRDHRQRQDSSPGLQEAVGQQLEVKPRPLRDTSSRLRHQMVPGGTQRGVFLNYR